ncbi:ArsR/SmtB family transcription factor [Methylobacterium planeticum]|uniref:Helix-turn-helix transcriptional regulator n=1 Tax=Methylobacterium planeticum TaxID=2615211 RepID=A0A6N6MGQ8_9HYPH|nr:metalloregulator ArsR/SmtB family transcription factor [Methylobacterium planeticum]KAB1068124.1 helix-turn-helix transcriptional regulator [Methylobacterium planeticum]
MDERQALAAFAALAQSHRLRLVRHLVIAGPDGLAAGTLAGAVGVSTSNLSFHLKELDHAGLIQSRREGRSIIYSAAYPALSGLIQFLMKDCCQGHPEVCTPAVAALAVCCTPAERRRPEPVLP